MPMLTMLRMRLPVWPFHAPERTRSANSAMRPSTACTSGTTLRPSTSITASRGRAQRRVQHGAVLGDVDLVAAKHGVALGAEPALLGELAPAAPWSRRDAVLRIVEDDAGAFRGEALGALRVVGEQRAQTARP